MRQGVDPLIELAFRVVDGDEPGVGRLEGHDLRLAVPHPAKVRAHALREGHSCEKEEKKPRSGDKRTNLLERERTASNEPKVPPKSLDVKR